MRLYLASTFIDQGVHTTNRFKGLSITRTRLLLTKVRYSKLQSAHTASFLSIIIQSTSQDDLTEKLGASVSLAKPPIKL